MPKVSKETSATAYGRGTQGLPAVLVAGTRATGINLVLDILSILAIIGLSFGVNLPEWRNWQTHGTQNPAGGDVRVGSIPTSGIKIMLTI